jgi:hypothetical protein
VESMEELSFNALVEQYLGLRLPGTLADPLVFAELSAEARGVIVRMLGLMGRAECPATEFSPQMIWLLATATPAMLPSAWGGRIPPVTSAGRHRKLDTYVVQQTRDSGDGSPVFIDLGCGFPPVTTVDTARCLARWSVFGVDRSFARYVLYDADGRYGCFDREGIFEYFQAPLKPLHDNPKSVREHFKALFADFCPRLKRTDDHASETVEKDGNRLVYYPIQDFEAENLKFIESDINDLHLPPARVVRCMNVLLYFEKSLRQRMVLSMGDLLAAGGILISGFNHPFGIYSRYTIHQKDGNGIRPSEFAFSPDNLRPLGVGPWLTIQEADEEAELLADLTRAIRRDRKFWAPFNSYVDALQEKHGICRRGSDGFNHFAEESLGPPPDMMIQKETALWRQLEAEGYTDGAVDALKRAGYNAWKNSAGDIAVSLY